MNRFEERVPTGDRARSPGDESAGQETDGQRSPPSAGYAEALADLERRVEKRLPRWSQRGPEDPAWVLLEVFAEALAEVRQEAAALEERVLPRVLQTLGDAPRWAEAASGCVVLRAADDLQKPIRIPAGTVVSGERHGETMPLRCETQSTAWCSPAQLRRVISLCGEDVREGVPYPLPGWDASPFEPFGARVEPRRYLYLGDPLLSFLRLSPGVVTLEWPGVPAVALEGRWEYSTVEGWRPLRVEFEEVRTRSGRLLRVHIFGPLAALSERRLEGSAVPWFRCHIPGGRQLTVRPPTWAAVTLDAEGMSARETTVVGTGAGVRVDGAGAGGSGESEDAGEAEIGRLGEVFSLPRPVARVLSCAGERWEDHSFAGAGHRITPPSAAWDPTLYLAWDSPGSAAVYFALFHDSEPASLQPPQLLWEYSTGRTFRALEVEDGTRGLQRSGTVSWEDPPGWQEQEVFGEKAFWLRARWVEGAYSRPPRVRGVFPNGVAVRQGVTQRNFVCDAVLDETGAGRVAFSFPDGAPERFAELEVRTAGREFEQVGVFDVHMEASPARGEVRLHAPATNGALRLELGHRWTGAVTLKIPRLRVGLGAHGNAAAGTLRVLEADFPTIAAVEQPLPLEGARDAESTSEFRRRIVAEWNTGHRAVTREDILRLTRAFDPGVARVEVKRDPRLASRLVVTAVPSASTAGLHGVPSHETERCPGAAFGGARLARLAAALRHRVPLGTEVEVVPPVYVEIELVVRGEAGDPLLRETVRREWCARLDVLLHPLTGGDGNGFPAFRWWQNDRIANHLAAQLPAAGSVSVASAPDLDFDLEKAHSEDGARTSTWRLHGASSSVRDSGWDPDVLSAEGAAIFPVLRRIVFESSAG